MMYRTSRHVYFALLLSIGACGGADETEVTQETGPSTTTFTQAPNTTAVVVTSDYAVYSLATVDLESGVVSDEVTTMPNSAKIKRLSDGRIYNYNQLGTDTVRVYAPGSWSAPLMEWSVGDGAMNPHDVELCGEQLFVSLYGGTTVDVYNPNTGVFSGAVDMSAFDDGDGLPEIDGLACVDDMLYATVQQLDRNNGWVANGGALVLIDPFMLTVEEAWYVGSSPTVRVHPSIPSTLIIRTGVYYEPDGGIFTFDTVSKTLSTPLVSEADLGVDIVAFVPDMADHAIVVGASLSGHGDTYSVYCVDTRDWSVNWKADLNLFIVGAQANDRGEAFLLARTHWDYPEVPGALEVWDIATCSKTASYAFSLDPYGLTFY
jgi:hypothetical protein